MSYNSTTQTVSFVPTANYTGPASFSYTISDGPNTATANVSLTVIAPPLTANNDSGFTVNEDGTLTISGAALLANDSDPNGLSFSISGVSNPSSGTVSYNSSTDTVTFKPATGFAGVATFNYTIRDTAGTTGTGQVSVTVNIGNEPGTQNLFSLSSVPSIVTVNDPNSVELGVRFTPTVNGTISGIRFYKGPQNVGTHIADLWSSNGTLLATATFTAETASGWEQVNFSTPVAVTAGTTYTASYHTNGFYSVDGGYFSSSRTNGQLSTPGGSNGVYAYGATSAFPSNSYNSSNYWVDVIFNGPGIQPPVANNDSGINGAENSTISIAASTLLANDTDPNGLALSITGVSNPAHGAVTYNSATQTISFVPTTNYVGAASFTYTIADGQGTASANVALNVSALAPLARDDNDLVTNENTTLSISASTLLANDTDPSGLSMSIAGVGSATNGTVSYNASNNTVSFVPTTGYAGSASFQYSVTDANGASSSANVSLLVNDPTLTTLFTGTQAPSMETVNDPNGVELGFRFQVSTNGQITGIRFYKDASNVGTHTGDLWSSTGTLLASATFTNETTSGWQQVNFAAPVSVTTGNTYVASYHTNGNYSADPNFFATTQTSGALIAPSSASSGGNGLYAYGSGSLFPTNSYNSTSYGVDVLFKPQLAS